MRKLVRGLVRPRTFIPLLLMVVGFLGAYSTLSIPMLSLWINAIDIAIWFMIVAQYTPVVWRVLREDNPRMEENFVFGIVLLFTALAVSRMWAIAVMMNDRPAWMIGHWLPPLCYWVIAVSGFYFIKVPGGTTKYLTWAVVLAVLIITLVLALTHAVLAIPPEASIL